MMRAWAAAAMFAAGCSAGGGTLTGAGGNTGMATGSGARGIIPGPTISGQAGNAPVGMNCGGVARSVQLLAPHVLIALDASSSMNDDLASAPCVGGCGQSSKWAAAAAAVNAAVAGTAGRVNWGIALFSTDDLSLCGTTPGVYVEPGPMTAPMIGAALSNLTTSNGGVYGAAPRQTRGAVDAAHTRLLGLPAPSAKHIVLITDGAPSCAPDGIAVTDDTAGTVAALTAAATAGVLTSVVGVATGGGPAAASVLTMGNAGRGLDGGGTFITSTGDDIRAALHAVADQTADCTFALPEVSPDGSQTRSAIGVFVNGSEIGRDTTATNGWDYVDATMASVRLHGNACALAKAAGPASVSVMFKCLLF